MGDDLLDLQPGAELRGTQYRVIRRVGAGGMGAVFEIEHVRLKKRLVAKTLHPGLRTRDDFLTRMETEAQTLARIAHPNIVAVHDLGVTSDGIPFFVMEKLEGSDLRRLLRSRRYLDLDDALMIVEDILEALAHAHREGVVHRDIKPENIFLARSGTETITKVLDFGIVKVMDDPRNLTGQRFLGTPQYASPEQLRGEAATEKTDLYAVGCVLFELVTGHRPFKGPTPRDYMMQHLSQPAPTLASVAQNAFPKALEEIVASALAKDPAKRPSNALWFASQLHQIRQVAQKIELAQANTTEEMLLTAIGSGAGSSGNLPAAKEAGAVPGDTLKDAPLAQALDATEPQNANGDTAPMPDPQPRVEATLPSRAAPTRTGQPVSLPPKTEQLSPSEVRAIDPFIERVPPTEPERVVSEAGVSLPSTVLARRTWRSWAVVALPILVALIAATVILVRGSRSMHTGPEVRAAGAASASPPPATSTAGSMTTSNAEPAPVASLDPSPSLTAASSPSPSPSVPMPKARAAARPPSALGAAAAPSSTSAAPSPAPVTTPAEAASSTPKKDPPPPRDDLMRTF